MAGYAVAEAVAAGRLTYLPVRLSAVPRLLADRRPDVAVVTGVRRGPDLVYGGSVGIGPAAARLARAVVVEVDPDGVDLGTPRSKGQLSPPSSDRPPTPLSRSEAPMTSSLQSGAMWCRCSPMIPPFSSDPAG